MDTTITIDLGQVARELNLSVTSVQRTLDLLDEGNTVPFITRYRKDQTGALDDEQIRQVQAKVAKLRALAERKQTILKSIDAQGKLTAELGREIAQAATTKRLEDLYLPYKPKKQTLATLARQRGLEPFAVEILDGLVPADGLETRVAEFVNAEHELRSPQEVLQGVRHLLAERFSERVELRDRLRRFIRQHARLVVSRVETAEPARGAAEATPAAAHPAEATPAAAHPADAPQAEAPPAESATAQVPADQSPPAESTAASDAAALEEPGPESAGSAERTSVEAAPAEHAPPPETPAVDSASEASVSASLSPSAVSPAAPLQPVRSETPDESGEAASAAAPETSATPVEGSAAAGLTSPEPLPSPSTPSPPAPADEHAASTAAPVEDGSTAPPPSADAASATPAGAPPVAPPAPSRQPSAKARAAAEKRATARTAKKQKKRQKLESAFKDYFQFGESLTKIPPHRVLAINRGERARILRVKLELDQESLFESAAKAAVPEEHPQREFLRSCLRDALQRLIVPSLEREARRELTEAAEQHALDVFVRNLRKLLLQPPVRGRRVLAIDPGFRSGCKLIALDEFGNVLGHDLIHVVGRDERKQESRTKLAGIIRQFGLAVIAIGNGTGCRETEQLVAEVLGDELRDQDAAYVVVNEAGASVYSTSPLGREELPDYDPVLRSAISIGRRLLDPLSELVKINPANIGVGLYQHDVKAKHLRDSLDAVVEACVNFVGVDVNTASPALLRYVSGLNQLTARRVYEHRRQHGPFRNREQFRDVPGFGEATYVQAAGFLKIPDGDNPLDATWIHPESYPVAQQVLAKLEADLEIVRAASPRPAIKPAAGASPSAAPEPTAETTPAETTPAETTTGDSASSAAAAAPAAVVGGESPAPTSAPQPQPVESPAEAAADTHLSAAPESAAATVPAAETAAASETAPAEPAQEQTASSSEEKSDVAETRPDALATEPPPAPRDSSAEAERRAAARAELAEKSNRVDVASLAAELGAGELLLRDILASLTRPGRDPRDDLPPPVFRRGIMKLEDLKPGMELTGTVLNVVDFGAFVDIGLAESGLIHISRLADRYVRDPHEVVGVGDPIKVWVLEVDKERRRVSLTAVPPGQERKRPEGGGRRPAAGETAPAARPAQRPPPAAGQSRPAKPPPRQQRGGRAPRPAKGRTWTQKSSLPAKPLTKAMEEGKEPLRSFSDLLQFYEKKQHGDEPDGSGG